MRVPFIKIATVRWHPIPESLDLSQVVYEMRKKIKNKKQRVLALVLSLWVIP